MNRNERGGKEAIRESSRRYESIWKMTLLFRSREVQPDLADRRQSRRFSIVLQALQARCLQFGFSSYFELHKK